jgi:hypothetical protein
MIDTKVRQPRVHTLDCGEHSVFTNYFESKHYAESSRAYILDVGAKLVTPVNDEFSRVSMPYNKAKSGYAVFIIPSEQIQKSGNKGNFGQALCDIDIGDKYNKCTIKYTDKNNIVQQEAVSTKYIERYFNFASSAYQSGYIDGLCSSHADLMHVFDCKHESSECTEIDCLEDEAVQNTMLSYSSIQDTCCRLYDAYSKFVDSKTKQFNYDAFREEVVSRYDDLIKPSDITDRSYFVRGLSGSNKDLFISSYVDGINDKFKHNMMHICYQLYPPEKSSKEYKFMLDCGYTSSDCSDIMSFNSRFVQHYDERNNRRHSENFMAIPSDIESEFLPFA